MVDARRRMLLAEIDVQCGFALRAYSGSTSALQRRDPECFWYSLQALLGAAAHLHRFLEADPDLKTALDVPDDSPLLRSELDCVADLRSACARWLGSRPRGPHRQSNFGPLGISQADPAVFARFIDPEESTAVLFGESYDLAQILAAIAILSQKVKTDLRQIREMV
jgi:hypothetical protein